MSMLSELCEVMLMANERTKRVVLRVTPEELALLRAEAGKEERDVSVWCRRALMGTIGKRVGTVSPIRDKVQCRKNAECVVGNGHDGPCYAEGG